MHIRVIKDNVGPEKMMVEMEADCFPSEASKVLKGFEQIMGSLDTSSTQDVTPRVSPAPLVPKLPSALPEDFVPATKRQLGALAKAADRAGKSVDEICKRYGVDEPSKLSKDNARDIISELNDQSGFSEIQRQQREDDISQAWR